MLIQRTAGALAARRRSACVEPARDVIYRHAWPVRVTHWINALTLFILVGSGLNILNAHPRLYWGQKGSDFDHPFITLHAWPDWLTVPSYTDLADARHWHFFFAWVLVANAAVYLLWSFASRHIQRDLWPTRADLRAIPRSIRDHLALRHPTGEAAKRYNVLQRLAYLGLLTLVFGMVVTGLAMSPGLDAFAPWLVSALGGRQSARTLHFLFASSIVLFIAVHLTEVVLAGAINEVRSMITGRYTVPRERP
ncbi:MAG TPA: cytochrome b/b6 domain-containing protein [Steroidobacteraceae bacterium]|nr:cytochrome b/b6 domain-containing protein [Steroidobacteraceae bacterium]